MDENDVGSFILYLNWNYPLKLNLLLNNSIEHSPSWEANGSSASHEIPCILYNPEAHHRIHKRRPIPVPILRQINPVHDHTFNSLEIHFNIILPSMSGSSKWSLSPQVSPPKPCMHLFSPPHVLHAPPTSCFFIWSSEKYMARSTSYEAPHHALFSIAQLPCPS